MKTIIACWLPQLPVKWWVIVKQRFVYFDIWYSLIAFFVLFWLGHQLILFCPVKVMLMKRVSFMNSIIINMIN